MQQPFWKFQNRLILDSENTEIAAGPGIADQVRRIFRPSGDIYLVDRKSVV